MTRLVRLSLVGVLGLAAVVATGVHYLAPPGAPSATVYSPPPPPPAATVDHDGPTLIARLEARPLSLPVASVGPTFRCAQAPATGGPVILSTPARTGSDTALLPFEVPASYAGALLVRGERLDASRQMGFADLFGIDAAGHLGSVTFDGAAVGPGGTPFRAMAILHAPVRSRPARFALAATNVAGCWAVEVDGYRSSQVFLVNMR